MLGGQGVLTALRFDPSLLTFAPILPNARAEQEVSQPTR